MERLIRFVGAALAAMVVAASSNGAGAGQFDTGAAATGKNAAVHTAPVAPSLPAAHFESILTDPRGALIGRKRETGWLLHYGTAHDSCARPDVTTGGRLMCVSW